MIAAAPTMTTGPRVDDLRPVQSRTGTEGEWRRLEGGQALVLGAPTGSATAAALVPFDDDLPIRLEATLRLWRALRDQPAPGLLTPTRRWRLARSLCALDGRSGGASYRAIAEVLFGRRRVAAEHWPTSPLKATTARLTAAGRAMVRGGYRDLLRLRVSPRRRP
ncbi:MAG: DUF2285 domain-containing protein [Allosphingosinicella sp.]|uniref:DUF2285 domain-containing protein n=1 Tax=Allosphingosinicella sp. TaxID=2823234 RepID=UPI003953D62B